MCKARGSLLVGARTFSEVSQARQNKIIYLPNVDNQLTGEIVKTLGYNSKNGSPALVS
jgi:hypothetical protein